MIDLSLSCLTANASCLFGPNTAVQSNKHHEEAVAHGLFRHVLEGGRETKSRNSSTFSSWSSTDSQSANPCEDDDQPEDGARTGTMKRRAVAPETPKSHTSSPPS